jgi:hypothetical protein
MIDYASDLHWDNAMGGGPHGWLGTIDVLRYKNPGSSALLIAGDTSQHISDTLDFLHAAAQHYSRVVAVLGNHEELSGHAAPATNVHLLDFSAFEQRVGDVAYLGGCLEKEDDVAAVASKLDQAQVDGRVSRVIVLSHFVPTPRIGSLLGCELAAKCNNLLDRVQRPRKDTTVVFGHAHLPFQGYLDGFRLLSHPRGYRGIRRDGTVWPRKFAAFA